MARSDTRYPRRVRIRCKAYIIMMRGSLEDGESLAVNGLLLLKQRGGVAPFLHSKAKRELAGGRRTPAARCRADYRAVVLVYSGARGERSCLVYHDANTFIYSG